MLGNAGYGMLLIPLMALLLVACSPHVVKGQPEERPSDIEALSEKYDLAISQCEDGEPCGYLRNRVTLNQRSHPWPVVGIYVSTRDFWYHAEQTEEGAEYILDKVIIETERSARQEFEEYFFSDEGQLISYTFRMGEEAAPEQDLRFFFSGGKLLDYRESVVEEEKDYQQWKKGDAATILKNAAKMRAFFAGMMEGEE
jgi:hypothetical protein